MLLAVLYYYHRRCVQAHYLSLVAVGGTSVDIHSQAKGMVLLPWKRTVLEMQSVASYSPD